jgi:hypothetical protein
MRKLYWTYKQLCPDRVCIFGCDTVLDREWDVVQIAEVYPTFLQWFESLYIVRTWLIYVGKSRFV